MGPKSVRILNGVPGKKGAYLSYSYDPSTKQYFTPSLDSNAFSTVRPLLKAGMNGSGSRCAILDTGLMQSHPIVKARVEESTNLTDEQDWDDHNGHGTIVALIFATSAPGAKILNVKILDETGTGTESGFIDGLQWAMEKKATVINMSCGIFNKKCVADCGICTAAKQAAQEGVMVVAAAGNEPGRVYCPAKVGKYYPLLGTLSVTAFDFDKQIVSPKSGLGNVVLPGEGYYKFLPVS